jgi:hypothetical protein
MQKIMLAILLGVISITVGFEVYNSVNNTAWTAMARTFTTLALGLVGIVLIVYMFTKIAGKGLG